MKYRAVKSNADNTVLAIGLDEAQGGQDYHGSGVWEDFTFDIIPFAPEGSHHEISGDSIIVVEDQ